MINLAGNENADRFIQEELYLAGIPIVEVEKTNSEVPYTFIGVVGKWTFRRAWYYWIVSVQDGVPGLPVDGAVKMHETPYPVKSDIKTLGKVIRCGGHCGAPSPLESGAYPLFNADFKKECEEMGKNYALLTYGEISELYDAGQLKSPRYVKSYHIDDQIGLNGFVKVIKSIKE